MEENQEGLKRPVNNPEKKKSGLIWIILNIVQLGAICFLLFMWNTQNEKIGELETSLTSTEQDVVQKTDELFQLRDEYIRIKKEKKKLGLDMADLDSQIEELDGLIQTLQKDKKAGLAKIKNLDARIAAMKEDIVGKDMEIAQLMAENDSLNVEIDTLNVKNEGLTENLETAHISLEELNEFIKAASVLKTKDILVTALKKNGKEYFKEEYKSKAIDRIRIKFNLIDNKAASKEKKQFYVRLITPSGNTFSDEYNGGGKLMMVDGKELEYSMSGQLLFDNTGQEMSFTMLKGYNYKAGNYIIEVVCEGYKIGQGYFIVK